MKNLKPVTCKNCGNVWTPRVENPKRCPICLSYKWNKVDYSKMTGSFEGEEVNTWKYESDLKKDEEVK